MGHQPEFGVQIVVQFIFTALYLSVIEVLVDYPTKSRFRENYVYSFNTIKKSVKFFALDFQRILEKKDIC